MKKSFGGPFACILYILWPYLAPELDAEKTFEKFFPRAVCMQGASKARFWQPVTVMNL